MDNKEYSTVRYEVSESKAKSVWRNIGIGVLAVFVAVLTVVVINL